MEFIPRMISVYQHRFKKVKTLEKIDQDIEKLILSNAMKMVRSDKITMIWEEKNHSFIEKIVFLFKRRNSHSYEFKKFNYPRAFLLLGIVSYLIELNNKKMLDDFKKLFDKYITKEGDPSFQINRVDQTPFGEVALKLYNVYREEKYIYFAGQIYNYLKRNVDSSDGIIEYRPDAKFILSDTIGLTVPFLLQYAEISELTDASKLAEQQIDYFINYGVDDYSNLPVHGIEKITKIKVGSANWGRGIGWYFLGLSACAKNNLRFMKHSQKLEESLNQLKNRQGLWTQFPGSSEKFDASSTLILFYSMLVNNSRYLTKSQFLDLLLPYLSSNGIILQTSGDTFGLNDYSKSFGSSELSQGFLLLSLSKLTENE